MKAFVITIDIPESHEVAEKCIASGKQYGVDVEKHMGITPEDNPIVLAAKLNIPTQKFRERYSRFENCLSAFLSHHSLWQWSIDNNEEVLILEHDAIFIDSVPQVPYRGILSLGAPSYGKFITPPNIGVNKLVSKQYLPGAHAYLVQPSAAKALVDTARTSACPTDLYICNALFDFVQEYYPWPVLARDNFTTIQREDGCLAKHRYGENFKIL
jgi:GR25 family glycosyltransferase involved in LPS biosynthesis